MKLSPDQTRAYDAVRAWSRQESLPGLGKPLLSLGGLAGTGKTTVLSHFAAETQLRVAYCAFTGRAASILGTKIRNVSSQRISELPFNSKMLESLSFAARWANVFSEEEDSSYCGTIHRLIYKPIINSREEIIGWTKREKLDRAYDLIVIDEASMVSEEMLDDLKMFGLRILAVGDHGQLPPVMSSGSVVQDPDLKLEKIHRQAKGNPIIQFAHALREGASLRELRDREWKKPFVRFGSKKNVAGSLEKAYAKSRPLAVGILCWTNKSRVALNATARKALKRKGVPKIGEVVMCLRNKPPIYNGMRGVLTSDAVIDAGHPWRVGAGVRFPDEGIEGHQDMCAPQFNREGTFSEIEDAEELGIDIGKMSELGGLFDYGYALTTHKSQGSQFDRVILFADYHGDTSGGEDYARFYYTAATRSSRLLTVLL